MRGDGQKDLWDKAQVVASVLLPLAIAFGGWMITRTQIQVARASLIREIAPGLLAEDIVQRRASYEAILMALPHDASQDLIRRMRGEPVRNTATEFSIEIEEVAQEVERLETLVDKVESLQRYSDTATATGPQNDPLVRWVDSMKAEGLELRWVPVDSFRD